MARDRERTRQRIQRLLEEQERSCPNETCPDHGETGQGNLVKNGHTDGGRQRYLCKTCGKTFTATKGTPFYQLHTDWVDVLEVLAAIAKGAPPQAMAEAKEAKVETILRWVERAGEHAEAVEEVLIRDFHVSRVELDELWSYVRNKGEKGGIRRRRAAVPSGAGERSRCPHACGSPGPSANARER
jgi:transposase-like protein